MWLLELGSVGEGDNLRYVFKKKGFRGGKMYRFSFFISFAAMYKKT